jgi:hypothetical protein
MPFANLQGVRIQYEAEGEGPPIVLAYGLTGNTTFWRGYGYVDPLKDEFRVVLQVDRPKCLRLLNSCVVTGGQGRIIPLVDQGSVDESCADTVCA